VAAAGEGGGRGVQQLHEGRLSMFFTQLETAPPAHLRFQRVHRPLQSTMRVSYAHDSTFAGVVVGGGVI
jgi:hypothetical protein